jgi:hypothetical protein
LIVPSIRNKEDALQFELEHLGKMGAAELRILWQSRKSTTAPSFATARLMCAAIAWDMQAEILGGELPTVRRRWDKVVRARARGATASEAIDGVATARPVAEGTRLIKIWRGRTHDVLVTADGIEWSGRSYRSLSAVARAITGVSRNGPAFFGLRAGGDGS